jgi:hypothetical protein
MHFPLAQWHRLAPAAAAIPALSSKNASVLVRAGYRHVLAHRLAHLRAGV